MLERVKHKKSLQMNSTTTTLFSSFSFSTRYRLDDEKVTSLRWGRSPPAALTSMRACLRLKKNERTDFGTRLVRGYIWNRTSGVQRIQKQKRTMHPEDIQTTWTSWKIIYELIWTYMKITYSEKQMIHVSQYAFYVFASVKHAHVILVCCFLPIHELRTVKFIQRICWKPVNILLFMLLYTQAY